MSKRPAAKVDPTDFFDVRSPELRDDVEGLPLIHELGEWHSRAAGIGGCYRTKRAPTLAELDRRRR